MENKIIRLTAPLDVNGSVYPIGYVFEMKRIHKDLLKVLKKEFEKDSRKFSGDLEFLAYGKNEVNVGKMLKTPDKLSLKELKKLAAKMAIKGWQACTKEKTLRDKIDLEVSRLKKAEKAKAKADVKADVKIDTPDGNIQEVELRGELFEIIREDKENVFMKGTRKLLDLLGLKDLKESKEIEITKEELEEIKNEK